MSSSLANMTINDQHHQENGVQMGHRSPGDAKMKGQRRERARRLRLMTGKRAGRSQEEVKTESRV